MCERSGRNVGEGSEFGEEVEGSEVGEKGRRRWEREWQGKREGRRRKRADDAEGARRVDHSSGSQLNEGRVDVHDKT